MEKKVAPLSWAIAFPISVLPVPEQNNRIREKGNKLALTHVVDTAGWKEYTHGVPVGYITHQVGRIEAIHLELVVVR
jgi:hypothetical protein